MFIKVNLANCFFNRHKLIAYLWLPDNRGEVINYMTNLLFIPTLNKKEVQFIINNDCTLIKIMTCLPNTKTFRKRKNRFNTKALIATERKVSQVMFHGQIMKTAAIGYSDEILKLTKRMRRKKKYSLNWQSSAKEIRNENSHVLQ